MENQKDMTLHENSIGSNNQALSNGLFVEDKRFIFLAKKGERLLSALYLLTNFFSDSEPIKWKIRDKGLLILSLTTSFKTRQHFSAEKSVFDLKKSVFEILSLLQVSSSSGLISDMNMEILKKEFDIFLENLKEQPIVVENISLTRNFFNVPEFRPEDHQKDIKKETVSGTSSITAGALSNKGQKQFLRPVVVPKYSTDRISNKEKKDRRQKEIVDFIRSNREVGIKDICLALKDSGEKTVQRELLELVSIGTLRKTGEKRWSRYSGT